MSDPFLSLPKACQDYSALQGLRVLVVDDDIDSCDLIVMTLEGFAVESRAVFSTQAAIEAFIQFQPDLLVSDIAMPDEDGYALIHRVRTLEADRNHLIPVIAVTAMASEEDNRRALSAGFQTWLPKPLDIDALVETVARLTGRKQPLEQ